MEYIVRVARTDVVAYKVDSASRQEAEVDWEDDGEWFRTESEENQVLDVIPADEYRRRIKGDC